MACHVKQVTTKKWLRGDKCCKGWITFAMAMGGDADRGDCCGWCVLGLIENVKRGGGKAKYDI